MLYEGFGLMILNYLGIPPGVAYRKHDGNKNQADPVFNELIESIVEITVDDVCLGNSPMYLATDKKINTHLKKKLELILKELNSIIKWAATDLLKYGVSVYDLGNTKQNNLILIPRIGDHKFYLNKQKEIVVADEENKVVKDVLVFINYNKSSLVEMEDKNEKNYIYEIVPSPIQLKNVQNTIKDLNRIEKAMAIYRMKLAKLVRLISVDVGISQGDKQQALIDSISSIVNANSDTLHSRS